MKWLYIIILAFGCGYPGDKLHWSVSVKLVAFVMTITFAFLVSRVVEDDRIIKHSASPNTHKDVK